MLPSSVSPRRSAQALLKTSTSLRMAPASLLARSVSLLIEVASLLVHSASLRLHSPSQLTHSVSLLSPWASVAVQRPIEAQGNSTARRGRQSVPRAPLALLAGAWRALLARASWRFFRGRRGRRRFGGRRLKFLVRRGRRRFFRRWQRNQLDIARGRLYRPRAGRRRTAVRVPPHRRGRRPNLPARGPAAIELLSRTARAMKDGVLAGAPRDRLADVRRTIELAFPLNRRPVQTATASQRD